MKFGGLGGRSRPLVGIDIGSSAVKVASLKRQGANSYQLESLGVEYLPPDCIVDGVIISKLPVADAITRIFKSKQIRNNQIATAISGSSVIVKKIALPAEMKDDLEESIQWEAEQYIPFDISDVNLDYQIVGNTPDGNRIEVILVAAKREKIADQTSVISMSGYVPAVVDIDAFALQNAYEVNYEPRPGTVAALLNVGSSVMNINIVRGSEFLFTRDIAMGGNHYNEFLQKELNISFEEAENYKRNGASSPDLQKRTVATLNSVSEILVLEVQKTLDYFKTTSRMEDIREIYLSGGACRTSGFQSCLQEKFQIPVSFLNPFKRIKTNNKTLPGSAVDELASEFAIAVGLALRTSGR
jgi:type IV pilus assembly protein PilM